jgi:predicted lipoprotein with Yx(FWY)xxD motif
MKNLLLTIGAIAVGLAVSVGIASASASPAAKVAVASSGLGQILVDGHGRTLYLFGKDAHGKSSCAGKCAAFWPPLIASGKTRASAGAQATLLGTTRRADGRLQVTYNHHPLYTFVKDTGKGQTNGQDLKVFGGEWDALTSAGRKVASSAPTDGGYGY